jgi:probable HAF family extracellular repeat protein
MRSGDAPVRGSAMHGSRVRSVGGLQRGQGALVVCVVAVLAMASAASAQCLYEVTYIEPPECPLGTSAGGFGLNDRGDVVGRYLECWDATDEAFVWTQELGFVTLPRPEDSETNFAYDINNAGDIVGYVTVNNRPVATLWRDFEVIELGTLPGDNLSEAHAINDAGQIVGYSHNNIDGHIRPFLWEDGVMIELKVPLGPSAIASGVSENGMVTGWMGDLAISTHAYLWRDGEAEVLPNPPLALGALPAGVNRLGEVGGYEVLTDPDPPGFVKRATLWRPGEVVVLPTPPEFRGSYAFDVGEAGQVIGYLDANVSSDDEGVMWMNGEIVFLTDQLHAEPVLRLSRARKINDRGQILAAGTPGRGPKLLTPIDPPVGDVNTDCTVDVLDLIELLEHWGPTTFDAADLDASGVVNVFDLLILLGNWGATDV